MNNRSIAYFSMEMALRPDMPTYRGGVDVLAGDTIHSASDLKLPMVAVTLVHRQGYFAQNLDASDWQTELPVAWDVALQSDRRCGGGLAGCCYQHVVKKIIQHPVLPHNELLTIKENLC